METKGKETKLIQCKYCGYEWDEILTPPPQQPSDSAGEEVKAEEFKEKLNKALKRYKATTPGLKTESFWKEEIYKLSEEYAQSQLPKEGIKPRQNTESLPKEGEESKQKIIGWLKKNGYERIEPNSYANDSWNVVLEDNQIAIANGNGDADYLPGYSLYALIGYFTYHKLPLRN